MPDPSMSSDAIRQRLEAAWAELQRVVQEKHIRLSIPVNFKYDTDLLIGATLNDTDYLLRESDARLPYIKKLEWRNRHLQEALERISEVVQENRKWIDGYYRTLGHDDLTEWINGHYTTYEHEAVITSLEALIEAVTETPKPTT